MDLPKPLTAKLEKEWDSDLFSLSGKRPGLAPRLGWKSYHTLRSRGSAPGYPDRTLWKGRVIFAELKRELTGAKSEDANRRPSARQVEILDGLSKGGAEVYLWRPSDLDEIARVLGRPWRFVPAEASGIGASFEPLPAQLRIDGEAWTPGSLWIAGAGRADGKP